MSQAAASGWATLVACWFDHELTPHQIAAGPRVEYQLRLTSSELVVELPNFTAYAFPALSLDDAADECEGIGWGLRGDDGAMLFWQFVKSTYGDDLGDMFAIRVDADQTDAR
jgi:hypothetical protein